MELKYYLDIFHRRRKVLLIVWGVVILLPLLAALVRGPMYQATSRAMMVKRDAKLLLSASLPEEYSSYNFFDSQYVLGNFTEILKSPAIGRRVAGKCELDSEPNEVFSSQPYLRFLFMGAKPVVNAKNVSDTDIFEFQGFGQTQEQALALSAALLEAFNELWNQMHRDALASLEAGVLARQVELAKDLAESFDKERKLKKTAGVGDFTKALDKDYEQLSSLKSSHAGTVTKLNVYDVEQVELKRAIKKAPALRLTSEQWEANPVVLDAKAKLALLATTLANQRITLTDEHAEVKAVLAQMEAYREIARQEAQKTYKTEAKELSPYHEELWKRYYDNDISRLVEKQRERALAGQIARQQGELVSLSSQMLNLSPVSKESETTLLSLANTFKALDAVRLLRNVGVSHALPINFAAKEYEGKKAYFPNYVTQTAVCFFLGMIFAVAAALLAEYLDPRCKTRLELEQITRLPVFHALPQGSPAGPEMDALGQELIMAHGDSPLVVGLVSVIDGEGKTTLAQGLTAVAAAAGFRTLLVSLDAGGGAAAPLAAEAAAPLLASLIRTAGPGRDVLETSRLAAGPPAGPNPDLGEFLERARDQRSYDFVVLDLPALSRQGAAFKLVQRADLVLMVAGLGMVDAYQFSKYFHQVSPPRQGQQLLLVANRETRASWRLPRWTPWRRAQA